MLSLNSQIFFSSAVSTLKSEKLNYSTCSFHVGISVKSFLLHTGLKLY